MRWPTGRKQSGTRKWTCSNNDPRTVQPTLINQGLNWGSVAENWKAHTKWLRNSRFISGPSELAHRRIGKVFLCPAGILRNSETSTQLIMKCRSREWWVEFHIICHFFIKFMRKLACHFRMLNRGTRFFAFESHSKKCLVTALRRVVVWCWGSLIWSENRTPLPTS